MAVDVFDDEGRPVREADGELVCTRPFPSMPVAFWDDPDGAKYRGAYFEHFPGVWRHGDWARLTAHDGLIIHGRSDATLNPGGVGSGRRRSTARSSSSPRSWRAWSSGRSGQGDVRVVLFVRLRPERRLDDGSRERIRRADPASTRVRTTCRGEIVQVADIPRTISGKITELAVREVIHGRPVQNVDALANPEALELFRGLRELES